MSTAILCGSPSEVESVAEADRSHSSRSITSLGTAFSREERELWTDGAAGGLLANRVTSADSEAVAAVWNCVGPLAGELGADSILELLEDFTEQTPLRLTELERIVGLSEWQAVLRRGAHSLKGSSSIFGLIDLERAAHELEQSALQVQLTVQAAQVVALETEFSRIRPVLDVIKRKLQSGDH